MPSLSQALDALDWVRREMMRLNAPDQMRNGLRERSVQKLCAKLMKESKPARADLINHSLRNHSLKGSGFSR